MTVSVARMYDYVLLCTTIIICDSVFNYMIVYDCVTKTISLHVQVVLCQSEQWIFSPLLSDLGFGKCYDDAVINLGPNGKK